MRKIAFLLGGVEISGGINVIFQQAIRLAEKGYSVSFISNKPIYPADIKWHPIYTLIKENSITVTWYTFNELQNISFDIAIATWWRTFFNLWKINAGQYFYFVQSIESRFYPAQEVSLRSVVESTYEADMGFITECKWISQYLFENYGHSVPVVLNGVDKNVFNREGIAIENRTEDKLKVLVEGPIDVHFKNIPNTLKLVSRSAADETWLLTSSNISEIEGVTKVFSKIPLQFTPTVYRSCDLIVKLSYVEGMFGPPLEMFHCGGTCIVYNVTGHDEYVNHRKNGVVINCDAEEEVIESINELKNNRNVLNSLKSEAIKTAEEWPDWGESHEQFLNALATLENKKTISIEALKKYSKRIWHIYENRRF